MRAPQLGHADPAETGLHCRSRNSSIDRRSAGLQLPVGLREGLTISAFNGVASLTKVPKKFSRVCLPSNVPLPDEVIRFVQPVPALAPHGFVALTRCILQILSTFNLDVPSLVGDQARLL